MGRKPKPKIKKRGEKIEKHGNITKKQGFFVPTPAMQIYAVHRARIGANATNREISKIISISESYISQWQNIPGFNEWLDQEVAYFSMPIKKLLEGVAMRNLQDYKFWEAMSKKHKFDEASGDAKNADDMVKSGKFVFVKPQKVIVNGSGNSNDEEK